MAKPRSKTTKKKIKKVVPIGHIYIHATFNNTIISIADENGNVIAWSSPGALGYKSSKKKTPYAAGEAAKAAAEQALAFGMTKAAVSIKGPGSGRESAVRSIQIAGIEITEINDVTPVPHNGCRPRKKPRG